MTSVFELRDQIRYLNRDWILVMRSNVFEDFDSNAYLIPEHINLCTIMVLVFYNFIDSCLAQVNNIRLYLILFFCTLSNRCGPLLIHFILSLVKALITPIFSIALRFLKSFNFFIFEYDFFKTLRSWIYLMQKSRALNFITAFFLTSALSILAFEPR